MIKERISYLLKEAGLLKEHEQVVIQEQTILDKDHVCFVYERRAGVSKVISENDIRRIKSFEGHKILITELLVKEKVYLMMSDPEINQLITLINVREDK